MNRTPPRPTTRRAATRFARPSVPSPRSQFLWHSSCSYARSWPRCARSPSLCSRSLAVSPAPAAPAAAARAAATGAGAAWPRLRTAAIAHAEPARRHATRGGSAVGPMRARSSRLPCRAAPRHALYVIIACGRAITLRTVRARWLSRHQGWIGGVGKPSGATLWASPADTGNIGWCGCRKAFLGDGRRCALVLEPWLSVSLSLHSVPPLRLLNSLLILLSRMGSARCSQRTARRGPRVAAHCRGRHILGIARIQSD